MEQLVKQQPFLEESLTYFVVYLAAGELICKFSWLTTLCRHLHKDIQNHIWLHWSVVGQQKIFDEAHEVFTISLTKEMVLEH